MSKNLGICYVLAAPRLQLSRITHSLSPGATSARRSSAPGPGSAIGLVEDRGAAIRQVRGGVMPDFNF